MTTILASGSNGQLVTVPIPAAAAVAVGNWAGLASIVNPVLQRAETGQPEGERMSLDVRGWTIPLVGDVGAEVAAHVNALWAAGEIYDPATGARPAPWPGDTAIAYYAAGTDTLSLRWVKAQPFVVWIVGGILLVLGLLYVVHLVGSWFGGGAGTFTLGGNGTSGTKGPSLLGWVAIVGGGGVFVAGLLWYYSHLEIAKAGAPKSTQIFEFGGR